MGIKSGNDYLEHMSVQFQVPPDLFIEVNICDHALLCLVCF